MYFRSALGLVCILFMATPSLAKVKPEDIVDIVKVFLDGGKKLPGAKEKFDFDPDDSNFNARLYSSMKAGMKTITVNVEEGEPIADLGANGAFWLSAIRGNGGKVYQCPFNKEQGWLGILLPLIIPEIIKQGQALHETYMMGEEASKYYATLYVDTDGMTVRAIEFRRKKASQPKQPKPCS